MAQEILDPVKVATLSVIDIAAGVLEDSTSYTIDGERLVQGDRILVKAQSVLTENGIYVVSANTIPNTTRKELVRANDFLDGSTHVASIVFVRKGNLLSDTGFILDTTEDVATVGTSNIEFKRFTINALKDLAEVTSYLTLRSEKGYPLTNNELDNNFKYLGNALDNKVDLQDFSESAIIGKINSKSYTEGGLDSAKLRSMFPTIEPPQVDQNGDLLGSLISADQNSQGNYTIPVRDQNGNITTNIFIGDLDGTAYKLRKGLTGQTGEYYTNVNNVDAGQLAILHGGTGASTAAEARSPSKLNVVHRGGDTMTGKLTFLTANSNSASLNIPVATATPTNPADGDVWSSSGFITFKLDNTIQQVARINSPTFTGDPRINSVVRNVDSNGNISDDGQIIPTLGFIQKFRDDYIQPKLNLKAPIDQPTFTNAAYLNYNVSVYPGVADSSTKIATTQWVQQVKTDFLQNTIVPTYETIANVALKAPKASPVFTGSPTLNANILDVSTNNKVLATTEWTQAVKQDFLQNTIAPTYATYSYVNTSARWMGSNKFVSVNLPTASDGVPGDIWIQTTEYLDENATNDSLYLRVDGSTTALYLNLAADPTQDGYAATKRYVDTSISNSISGLNLASTYVNVSGDTMTGFLTLHANPTSNLHAATKGYVDSVFNTVASTYLDVAGDSMTGFLTLHANPTSDLHAATKGYVDASISNIDVSTTAVVKNTSSAQTMSGKLKTPQTIPADEQDVLATKKYVDDAAANAAAANAGSPIGSILYYPSVNIPLGWMECDGRSLNKNVYTNLFNVIGYTYGGSGDNFKLPDLRGEFIRGWDHGRGVDRNRAFGSWQRGTAILFDPNYSSHNLAVAIGRINYTGANNLTWTDPDNATDKFGVDYVGTDFRTIYPDILRAEANNLQTPQEVYTNGWGAGAARPRNVALVACIKVQGLVDDPNQILAADIINAVNNKLDTFGGTLTGFLTLHSNPTSNLHAATKQYVDTVVANSVSSVDTTYINASGDTMSGFLTLHSNPTSNLHAATKQYVDAKVSGPNVFTVSGASHTYSYTNIVGNWTDTDNYFDVFPPSGYTMSNLQSFIASIWYISFAGRVDSNDSMRCTYQGLSDRVRVYVGNTEQRAAPAASWLAVWIK